MPLDHLSRTSVQELREEYHCELVVKSLSTLLGRVVDGSDNGRTKCGP